MTGAVLLAGLGGPALAGCGGVTGGDPGLTRPPGGRGESPDGQRVGRGPCPPPPACDAPPPPPGPARAFRHKRSSLITALGPPQHRGRDLLLTPSAPQWVLAKIAYAPSDKDLSDEDVDIHLLRGCGPSWEKIGTFRTTAGENSHPTVLGVADQGGQIFVELSRITRPLDVGRHRVRLVVAGDGSATDLFIEVLPPGARVAVTDIDGTLTESEMAVASEIAGGRIPEAHPGAAELMHTLVGRGYHLFYLTARPDWLVARTRAWLALRGFPPGILHTTTSSTGVIGEAAAAFKAGEIGALRAATGIIPDYAFGNMPSDVATYGAAGIAPSRTFYFSLIGDLRGGVGHADYRSLLPTFASIPPVCL
jgi:hypothetical protein